ncbi:MAG: HAMP domain-containing protein [Actinomycetia bacterium]|nr:HAMP domain-containing protein [Actinomycetes bacterium]
MNRSTGWAASLAPWTGSIRFRLALIWSVVVFSLASLAVAVIYVAVAAKLDEPTVTRRQVAHILPTRGGRAILLLDEEMSYDAAEFLELEANQRALDLLRDYSFGAVGGLFVLSMGAGWIIAGRALAPIGGITKVAREIQAQDLSQRIDLDGPDDELRQMADTFDAMLARLEASFTDQRRFIQEASHELRNPLAVMRTNLDVVLADPDADAIDLRKAGEIVHRATERMSRVIEDLVTHARLESPQVADDPVDVADLIEAVTAEFVSTADARGIDLVAGDAVDLRVCGDRVMLQQALGNLVGNAVRLAPEQSTVQIAAGADREWVWITVADEGPGIPPSDHDRVFRRFWTGSESPVQSGLGLSIVRQVIEGHGGRVGLQSEEGSGSSFSIWLRAL